MMPGNGFTRRNFLLGAGGLTLGLPWLESLASDPSQVPKRLVVVYNIQGIVLDEWIPTGGGGNFTLSGQVVEPLAPFKDDLLVLTGIDDESAYLDPVNAHSRAAAHALTGIKMVGSSHSEAGGQSIDNLVADRIVTPAHMMKSLHLGVRSPWEPCFTGPAEPVGRQTSPSSTFDQLFGAFESDEAAAELARLKARRQSVLDAVRENIHHTNAKVGSEDKVRLDAYLERVQEIERRVNAEIILGEGCEVPDLELIRSPYRTYKIDEVPNFHPYYDPDIASRAQIELLAMALACNATPVATLAYGQWGRNEYLFDGNGDPLVVDADWHQDVVHPGPDASPQNRERLVVVQRWTHTELAYLLERLASLPEGDGSVLDNCLVLFVNEFSTGWDHYHRGKPFVIAGSCGGAIETERWLQFDGEPHNRLLLSVLRAFDIEDAVFGEPDLCGAGPLPGIV